MNFKVHWKPIAESQLAEVWLRAKDRAAVVAAADSIVERLENDPLGNGESRSGADRFIIETPLSVTYRIDERSQTVLIVDVHYHDPKSK